MSAKLELLEAVVATGVREVEATAFVSPSKVPALADAAALAAELHRTIPASSSPPWSPAPTAPSGPSPRAWGRSSTWCRPPTGISHANVGRTTAEATALIADIVAHRPRRATPPSRSSSRPRGTARSTAPPPRSACSTSPRPPVERGADRFAIADTIGTTTPRPGHFADRATASGDRRHSAGRALPQHPRRRAGQRLRRGRLAGSPGWTPRSAGWAAARSPRAPAATSPPRIWCTCCGTAISTSTSTCRPRSRAADVAQTAVGHELPSALLRAGDRIRS